MNDEYSNEKSQYKTPEEIKEIIQKALVSNKILGYLNGNILYMKSFGKDYSLDKIFFIIGTVILIGGFQLEEIFFQNLALILSLGLGSLSIGLILQYFLKFYLVYDLDREVFYTITNIHNTTLYKTNEIRRRELIELGVDVLDKNPGDNRQYDSNVLNFKGDIMDNPGLRSSFIGLKSNGTIVIISDPVALRQPHEAAVARCNLFAECFGMNAVICKKYEGINIVKENNQYKLTKYNKEKEWEDARNKYNKSLYISLVVIIAIFIGCYLLSKYLSKF